MAETEDGTNFDEWGICQACRSSEQKMHIDWVEREKQLRRILDSARATGKANDSYDCVIPISGGKDSAFQLHVLRNVYEMNPLAVTFSHNWFSETGWYNLVNCLEKFDVDHIMYTPKRSLVNRFAKRSIEEIGDSCWHCHTGCGSFPLHVASKFKIPLLVYGEPGQEGHGRGNYSEPERYDREYFLRVSARKTPDEMRDETIDAAELSMFQLPSQAELDEAGVSGIHLGSYIFWDDERQMEFIRETYGWRETQMEGTYKCYKSAECIMPGMHDFTLYLKRGYGRATIQASLDVRNGLLTREEGFALARQHDGVRPEALDYFLEITGMSEEDFYAAMERQRMKKLQATAVPVLPKTEPNAETIRPLAVQMVEAGGPIQQNPAPRKHAYSPPLLETPPIEGDEPQTLVQANERSGPSKSPKARSTRDQLAPKISSFLEISIRGAKRAIASGALTPDDLANTTIHRIQMLDPIVHAFESYAPEQLLAAAQKARPGGLARFLEGIPIGVKDVMNTRDQPTQMGSAIWKGFTPGNDARVVESVRQHGGLVAGKTVTSEFAVHALGPTLNPHDPERTPGTSSSGSAVAVALGMVPAALATQTAGSIVRPASYCGVYGYKPSFGLVPRTGTLKTTDSLDTIGFLATWYEDVETLFDAIRVRGPNYPLAHAALTDKARQGAPIDRPWKIALVRTHTWDVADTEAQEAFKDWAGRLAALDDVTVEWLDLPSEFDDAHEVHRTIYDRSLSYYFQAEFETPEHMSPIMREIVERATGIDPESFEAALERQEELAAKMDHILEGYDAMISLSTAGPAPLRDASERDDPALMWTLLHLPVLAAPALVASQGLPMGIQVAARRFNDKRLFRFADRIRAANLIPEGPHPLAPVANAAHSTATHRA